MSDDLAARLAHNVKELRQARGLTQARVSELAALPRATWANLESGLANPTLAVLHAVARALEVPLEELISTPRADVEHFAAATLPRRSRGRVQVRSLLPGPPTSTELERIELPPKSRLAAVAHAPGTREYLACESGSFELVVAEQTLVLAAGDVAAFRADRAHAYANPGSRSAVAYSVVLLKPTA